MLLDSGSRKERKLGEPVGGVVSLEVLDQHLVNAVSGRRIAAGIPHRASTSVQVLPHHHRNFPEAWVGPGGTGRDHAVVEELVVEGVRPAGRSILVDRHRGVVGEVRVPEHLEHVVPADLLGGQNDR